MFTINSEHGEEPCVPYLHISGATPMSSGTPTSRLHVPDAGSDGRMSLLWSS